ncbi:PP2C family protein-serine/threonine phosphatase [Leptolyngbya sp. FACHB-261]|uniref:PP2C family protein-serine/threonine phosphatase n=1 Tax=Leptolyngbya sp. FACHB-261 TaxID=2692806 RepID=UPI00168518B7|nr:SpoIIE family protein phosphatase [Leptolyngbya sp. FACHB-261]MBD2102090.1 SpoIIE family protein phosphatase [Leptolyngbya sp. FACHB-261]
MSKILVVDDQPTNWLIVRRLLQDEGHQVTVAKDGAEGLLQAKQTQPDLIVCDWMMPVMDGLEMCRQLKADPDLATTFFILLTARDAITDRIRGLDAGADEFLSKPIEPNELKARVRAGLRLRQLTQDLQAQKQALELELAEAAEYVSSLLPPQLTGTVTTAARFIPSRQLGGDCFDYYWLDSEHLLIYLLDVSGHGLRAALPSISILNLLRSQSLPGVDFRQPHEVLKALNETVQISHQDDTYFTIWYGVYHQSERRLTYASAGHPPAILLSGSGAKLKTERLRTPAVPIGMFTDLQYASASCEIEPASTLYVFSDGVYEIEPDQEQAWGLDAFVDLLMTHAPASPFSWDQLLQAIQTVNGKNTFDDDFSLLKIHFS